MLEKRAELEGSSFEKTKKKSHIHITKEKSRAVLEPNHSLNNQTAVTGAIYNNFFNINTGH